MRFLRESLLSFFVVGVVLCLYFLAGVAALLLSVIRAIVDPNERTCVILKARRIAI